MNAWTSHYETRYVYHATWAHLNGVFQKSLPSVCVSVYVSPVVAWQHLGKKRYPDKEYTRNNRNVHLVFYEVPVVPEESRQLVLPRTHISVDVVAVHEGRTVHPTQ
jgi:hypothetical protein